MKTESHPATQTNEVGPAIVPHPTTEHPLSRQRLWQIKMREQGRCWRCGDPASRSLCPAHLVKERERQRRIRQAKTRNLNARSYAFPHVGNTALLAD